MGWIQTILSKLLLSGFFGSYVRHILTGLGGFLIAKELANAEQATNLVNALVAIAPGVISYLIGQLSSLKRKTETTKFVA